MTRLLMLDVESRELVHTFRELWSVALRDDIVQRAVDDFYDEVIDRIAAPLQRVVPGLSAQTAFELVTVSALLSEGMAVVYGTRRKRRVPLQRMVEVASRMVAEYSRKISSNL